MRTLSLLLCAALLGLAAPQFRFRRPQRPRNFFRPQQNFRPQQSFRAQQNFRPQQNVVQNQGPPQQSGGLYYSWRDPAVGRNAKFSWGQANAACQRRNQRLVSLETAGKNQQIVGEIASDNIPYIWTSGQRTGQNSFQWASGQQVQPLNWSRTGGRGVPQPDNREGDENCLAILNRFYPGDQITWHDVSCHHKKPYICE
ncbi:regenerating islet-derived protein 3-alpha-like [Pollicipes pollicipes]|uniref:regenerating islet-derived protein 3-alpha-like n=1 Tax=Pollicipes pollicipes TaxID=41117 RepID=UPI0018856B6D|nr:regenerating islet-derived protein 3-alpha-like [Pollicipes pollicipes]XP_037089355.1 regenerating islet-derived protein 3-alpha-like [Pollicipes pollicipes]